MKNYHVRRFGSCTVEGYWKLSQYLPSENMAFQHNLYQETVADHSCH